MGLVGKVIQLPAFAMSVAFYYWSFLLASLLGYIKWLDFKNKRNDVMGWAQCCVDFFGLKFRKIGQLSLSEEPNTMYLCNHRCWADFFIDMYITEGRGMILARLAVAYAFPAFMLVASYSYVVILFDRTKVKDKDKFNQYLGQKMDKSYLKSLYIYPEGHRATKPQPLPLKRGMLKFAYSRQMNIQCAITRNKEFVMHEKSLRAKYGQTMYVGYSELIFAKDYDDFEKYMVAIQKLWDSCWAMVYTEDEGQAISFRDYAKFDIPKWAQDTLVYSMVICTALLAATIGLWIYSYFIAFKFFGVVPMGVLVGVQSVWVGLSVLQFFGLILQSKPAKKAVAQEAAKKES